LGGGGGKKATNVKRRGGEGGFNKTEPEVSVSQKKQICLGSTRVDCGEKEKGPGGGKAGAELRIWWGNVKEFQAQKPICPERQQVVVGWFLFFEHRKKN